MNKVIQHLLGLVGPAFSYLFHLAFVAVLAWVGTHFHLSIPVIPTSLGTFFGLGFARVLLKNLGHAWHSGRMQAQAESDAHTVIQQIIADAGL